MKNGSRAISTAQAFPIRTLVIVSEPPNAVSLKSHACSPFSLKESAYNGCDGVDVGMARANSIRSAYGEMLAFLLRSGTRLRMKEVRLFRDGLRAMVRMFI